MWPAQFRTQCVSNYRFLSLFFFCHYKSKQSSGYSSANDSPFHKKWITIGATKDSVYSKTAVTKRLIVITFSTGSIPASKAPPCTNVNNPVDIRTAATIFIMFQRFPLLYSNLVAFVHEQDSWKHRQNWTELWKFSYHVFWFVNHLLADGSANSENG